MRSLLHSQNEETQILNRFSIQKRPDQARQQSSAGTARREEGAGGGGEGAEKFVEGRFFHELATIHEKYAITDFERKTHLVRHNHHRHARFRTMQSAHNRNPLLLTTRKQRLCAIGKPDAAQQMHIKCI